MTFLHGLFAAISAVILFLYGLQGFSRELQESGGARLKLWLERVTASRWRGFLVGAFATAVLQSSSAITLVDGSLCSLAAAREVARKAAW